MLDSGGPMELNGVGKLLGSKPMEGTFSGELRQVCGKFAPLNLGFHPQNVPRS